MTTGAVTPDLEAFRALARDRRVIPVTRTLLADGATPVALYRALHEVLDVGPLAANGHDRSVMEDQAIVAARVEQLSPTKQQILVLTALERMTIGRVSLPLGTSVLCVARPAKR